MSGNTSETRCAVCGWPLAETVEKGCTRGNCSLRPRPKVAYDSKRVNREYGKELFAPVAPESYKPAEWRRQESCSECDGDGCANCAPQTSAEQIEEKLFLYNKQGFEKMPAATPVTVEAPDGLRKLATWLERWKLVEDTHANVALQVAIEQLFDAEENGEIKQLLATPKPLGDIEKKKEQYGIGVTDHLLSSREAQAESKGDLELAESIVTKHYATINELIHGDFVNLVQFILRVSQKG